MDSISLNDIIFNASSNISNQPASRISQQTLLCDIIGTSDCNNFIPIMALKYHNLLSIKKSEDSDERTNILEYGLNFDSVDYLVFNNYRDLKNSITGSSFTESFSRYRLRSGGVDYMLKVMNSILLSPENKILTIVAINTDFIENENCEEILKGMFDPSIPRSEARQGVNKLPKDQLVLFVSNDLIDNPIYKNLKKRIDAEYIELFRQLGIDIVYSSNIEERLFKNNGLDLPKFSKISDIRKHLLEEVPEFILE